PRGFHDSKMHPFGLTAGSVFRHSSGLRASWIGRPRVLVAAIGDRVRRPWNIGWAHNNEWERRVRTSREPSMLTERDLSDIGIKRDAPEIEMANHSARND